MLRRYLDVPLGVYVGLFVGLFIGDYLWRGFGYAPSKLPIHAAVFIVVLGAAWLLRRKTPTAR